VKLVQLRRPKIACSPSCAYYRPKKIILLGKGHTLGGEHVQEGKGKGKKPKT
jgi:hypothetical protein